MTRTTREILNAALLTASLLLLPASCDHTRTSPQEDDTIPARCDPLSLIVEGTPLPLEHALARYDEASDVYIVSLFNTPAIRCRDFVQPARFTRPGELEIRASFADNGEHSVSLGPYAHLTTDIHLEHPPEETGQQLSLCITRRIEVTPDIGPFKDQRVSILGRFSAPLCPPLEE